MDTTQEPEVTIDDPHRYIQSPAFWDTLEDVLEAKDHDRLVALLDRLHVADIADVIEQADPDTRTRLITLWGRKIDGLVLTELEEGVRNDIIDSVPYSVLVSAVRDLESDDLLYLVEDLEADKRETLLRALDDSDRAAIAQSLTYPEYSAGRLMQREFFAAPEHWTAGETIDYLRVAEDLPEEFHNVIVVNPAMKPVGLVMLSKVITAKRSAQLLNLVSEDFHVFRTEQPQDEVGYAFNQYHLVSAPVVDADGRLVGVIMIDDAMEILEDEAEEDMKRLAGLGDEELSDNVWQTTRLRFPWLFVNLITAIVASLVIAQFEATINQIVALAVLMPIVASMGGNAATQTLTVAVRGLATKDLTPANMVRIVTREVLVGLGNGIIFAVLIAGIGLVWFGSPMLGVVLAAAMVINLVVAGFAGILIPVVLEKAGADPALASGAFVTTVTDVVGFLAFLGLASIFLL